MTEESKTIQTPFRAPEHIMKEIDAAAELVGMPRNQFMIYLWHTHTDTIMSEEVIKCSCVFRCTKCERKIISHHTGNNRSWVKECKYCGNVDELKLTIEKAGDNITWRDVR